MPLPEPHPTVILTLPNNEIIEVDSNIRDLVQELWFAGMETIFSCEGYDVPEDLTRFSTAESQFYGYILLRRTEMSMRFVKALLTEWSPFYEDRHVTLHIEFDSWEEVDRICIRFPKRYISLLENFVKYPWYHRMFS